jgi:MFS family permease
MSSYAAVLRTPRASRAFAAALVGRLSYGTAPLSLVLAARDSTGSFAEAGTALAVFSATSVLLSPCRAALIDRWGLRRGLLPMAALYAALLGLLALPCPGAPFVPLAALAGACTPPLGPVMRTVWRQLLPERDMLRRAYSLDGVVEELLYVLGPLIVGVLTMAARPAAGVAVSAGLVLAGTLALALSDVPFPAGVRGSTGGARVRLRVRPLVTPVLVAAGAGVCLGAVDLLAVAFTEAHHRAGAVSWVLAALAAGSTVGGLVNGAVSARGSARARLCLCGTALGLALAGAGLVPGVYAFAALVALAGVFVAPTLTTAYLVADEDAAPGGRTKVGAWVNTAVNAGSSGGTAGVGLLVGHVPLGVCFALAAIPVVTVGALGAVRLSGRAHGGPAANVTPSSTGVRPDAGGPAPMPPLGLPGSAQAPPGGEA